MIIDIYCKDRKCPICERDLEEDHDLIHLYSSPDYFCPNRCYQLIYYLTFVDIMVFDKTFDEMPLEDPEKTMKRRVNELRDLIKYWKKNDRYLMRILEESK